MVGWALRQAAIWSILGLILYAVITHFPTSERPTVLQPTTTPPVAEPRSHGGAPNSLTFRANRQGHVVLDAYVNGSPVRFLVDTGSTMVALTPHDAEAAGIFASDLNFSMRTMTANGVARAAPVRLREVRIGQLSISDVQAAVVENLGVSLLGQSFLTRLDSYEMRDGVLTLNWN